MVRVERWSRRTSVRWAVFLLCFCITILALFMESKALLRVWEASLVFTFFFFLWPFLQGTFLLYTRGSTGNNANFEMSDSSFFAGLDQSDVLVLKQLGFGFAGCVSKERQSGTKTDVALFVHENCEESAQIAQIRTSLRTRHLVIFATKFADGLVVETTNAWGPQLFKAKLKFRTFRFRQIRHTPDLYLIHQKLKEEFSATRTALKFTPTERIAVFIQDAEEVHRLNLAQGDYKPHPAGDRYVYTLRGALRHTFLRTWPVGAVREMLAESDSSRKARQLGFQIHPKLGVALPLEIHVRSSPPPINSKSD